MNVTALSRLQQGRSDEQHHDISLILVSAMIYIVENYFLQLSPSFVLTSSCQGSLSCNFFNDLLETVFKVWDAPPIQIVSITGNIGLYVPGRRYFNFIIVDSYEAFRSIDMVSYTAEYNNNEYYYIFLHTQDHLIPTEMERIFDYCWSNYMINCNVQVQNAMGEVLIYTYYPFTSEKCGQASSKLINQFNGSSLVKPTLFPKKLKNFYGCSLRGAMWHVPPFMYLEYFRNGSGRILGGIEGHLLNELKTKLNFRVEVKVPPNDEQRGVVMGKNITGALLMLSKREVDFSLGSFRVAGDRASVSTMTTSYYQTKQVVCVPLAAYKLSSLEILLFPFEFSTWLLLLAVWLLCLLVITLGRRGHRQFPFLFSNHDFLMNAYLNVFLMAIGMPAITLPDHHFARFLCTDWMLFTLVLRTVYQALLFHMIRTQLTNHVPQTFMELLVSNYTIVMNRVTYRSLESVSFISALNRKIIDSVVDTTQFEYLEKNPLKNMAAAGPLDFLLYYGSIYKKAGVFKILSQHIVGFPITMYLTKHSYLSNQFNEELIWFRAIGLIDAWSERELDEKYLSLHHHLKDNIFGLDELYMLFVIATIGYSISIFIFALELLSRKAIFLKKAFLNL